MAMGVSAHIGVIVTLGGESKSWGGEGGAAVEGLTGND